jgi:hypothetical protein
LSAALARGNDETIIISCSAPRTELAAARFKRLMAKAGPALADGLHKIVVDVLSEAAKKAVLGQ